MVQYTMAKYMYDIVRVLHMHMYVHEGKKWTCLLHLVAFSMYPSAFEDCGTAW